MKKNIIKIVSLTFFLITTHNLFAPERPSLVMVRAYPIEPFRNLINAIGMVETGFDTLAYNPAEQAAGFFQIRPIRLLDYNIRTGSNYTMEDMYDYNISEKIFLYYASRTGPYDFEMIARNWNGSGEATIEYWKKVREHL